MLESFAHINNSTKLRGSYWQKGYKVNVSHKNMAARVRILDCKIQSFALSIRCPSLSSCV